MEIQSNSGFKNRSLNPPASFNSPVPQQDQNPFGSSAIGANLAFTLGSQSVKTYFDEMRKAIGKDSSESQLSKEDFKKYEQILLNTEELLEDTIKFSERAASSAEVFKQQKQFLEERISLTQAIAGLFQESRKISTSTKEESKPTKPDSEKEDKKAKKAGLLSGISIPFFSEFF